MAYSERCDDCDEVLEECTCIDECSLCGGACIWDAATTTWRAATDVEAAVILNVIAGEEWGVEFEIGNVIRPAKSWKEAQAAYNLVGGTGEEVSLVRRMPGEDWVYAYGGGKASGVVSPGTEG